MAERGRRRASSSDRLATSWRSVLLTIGALIGAACLLATATVLVAGLRPIAFSSGSMRPAISPGDLALAEHVSAGEVGVGDVVSVRDRAGRRVTHRVTRVEAYGSRIRLTLKADAASAPDAQAYDVTSVDRVVTTIPWLGHVVGSPVGLVLGGGFVACLGLVVLVPHRRVRGARRADG
jgi:signal peptidase I